MPVIEHFLRVPYYVRMYACVHVCMCVVVRWRAEPLSVIDRCPAESLHNRAGWSPSVGVEGGGGVATPLQGRHEPRWRPARATQPARHWSLSAGRAAAAAAPPRVQRAVFRLS